MPTWYRFGKRTKKNNQVLVTKYLVNRKMSLKTKIKKVGAAAAGTLMVGATLAGAASLADYPSPFVQDGEVQSAKQIVVGSQGTNPAGLASDIVGGIDIAAKLGNTAFKTETKTKTVETEGSETGYSLENGLLLERVGEKVNLGEQLSAARDTIRGDNMPLLADTTFQTEDGDELVSRTDINIDSNAKLEFDKTEDELDSPVVNFDTTSGVMYQLEWNPDAFMPNQTAGEDVELFGKTLSFAGSDSDLTPSKFVMYGSAKTVTISTGESKDVMESSIEVLGANDAQDTATIEVNGERKTVSADNQYTIGGEKVYVEDVFITTIPEKTASVSVSVGSEEWTFEDGEPLQMGGDDVDGTSVSISSDSGKVSKVTIDVTPSALDEDNNPQELDTFEYLEMGEELVDPVFGTFKFSFAGMNVPLDSDKRNTVEVSGNGDNIEFSFTNFGGLEYSMNLINESMMIRDDLATESGVNVSEDDYFMVATSSAPVYSHILQVKNVDPSNDECEIQDVATDENVAIYESSSQTCVLDLEEEFTVDAYDGQVDLTGTTGVTDTIYTQNQMKLNLSMVDGNDTETILVSEDYSGEVVDDLTSGEVKSDAELNVTYDSGDSQAEVRGLSEFSLVSVEDKDNLALSPLGTYVEYDDEDDQYYKFSVPPKEVQYKAFVGPSGSEVSETGGAGTATVEYTESTPSGVPAMGMLDSAEGIGSAKTSKDLILVGGPAVNALTAELAGQANSTVWDLQTWRDGEHEDMSQIVLVNDAFTDGKVALVVAGHESEDTRAASKVLANFDKDAYSDLFAENTTEITLSKSEYTQAWSN